jgi:amino acid transporter
VRESARAVAVPVYAFVFAAAILVIVGVAKLLTGGLTPPPLPVIHATHELGAWVVLHAFASGCVALTGIEAVSNGVQAFREPRVRNARVVMVVLGALLAIFFFGMSTLARALHVVTASGQETVMSQIGRAVFGTGPAYYILQFSTLAILILAANTSFQGFPRVARLLAQDGYLPRQLANLGDRLVFNNGIALLGVVALVLVLVFGGSTHALIPLYAVGVFLSFTLSQVGLLRRWLRERQPGWWLSSLFCLPGAIATALVLVVVTASKFIFGAWMVVIAVPAFVRMFLQVRAHYDAVAVQLTLDRFERPKRRMSTVVVVPVASLHRGTVMAIEYAKSLGARIRAVHVVANQQQHEALKAKWAEWEPDIPLIGLPSPYRSLVRPVVEYVQTLRTQYDTVTVLIPEFVVAHWWQHLLHNQSAIVLDWALRHARGVQVLHFRYQLDT